MSKAEAVVAELIEAGHLCQVCGGANRYGLAERCRRYRNCSGYERRGGFRALLKSLDKPEPQATGLSECRCVPEECNHGGRETAGSFEKCLEALDAGIKAIDERRAADPEYQRVAAESQAWAEAAARGDAPWSNSGWAAGLAAGVASVAPDSAPDLGASTDAPATEGARFNAAGVPVPDTRSRGRRRARRAADLTKTVERVAASNRRFIERAGRSLDQVRRTLRESTLERRSDRRKPESEDVGQ